LTRDDGALLLHGYAMDCIRRGGLPGLRERNDFVMIVAARSPDFRTISDFRKRHLKALAPLFCRF